MGVLLAPSASFAPQPLSISTSSAPRINQPALTMDSPSRIVTPASVHEWHTCRQR
jgi:hypothetical protein